MQNVPRLTASEAAQKYNQGFDFVNCGADIVALTAWMTKEMSALKSLTMPTAKDG